MTLHRATQLAEYSAIGFAVILLLASIRPSVAALLACLVVMSAWTAGAVMWGLSRHHEADQPPSGEATPAGPESTKPQV
jgi:hypothetical protein